MTPTHAPKVLYIVYYLIIVLVRELLNLPSNSVPVMLEILALTDQSHSMLSTVIIAKHRPQPCTSLTNIFLKMKKKEKKNCFI